jgi:hypothetical protein
VSIGTYIDCLRKSVRSSQEKSDDDDEDANEDMTEDPEERKAMNVSILPPNNYGSLTSVSNIDPYSAENDEE